MYAFLIFFSLSIKCTFLRYCGKRRRQNKISKYSGTVSTINHLHTNTGLHLACNSYHPAKLRESQKNRKCFKKTLNLALPTPTSSAHHTTELIYCVTQLLWLPQWKPSFCTSHWHYLSTSPWNLRCSCSQPLATMETLRMRVELRMRPLQLTQQEKHLYLVLDKNDLCVLSFIISRIKVQQYSANSWKVWEYSG